MEYDKPLTQDVMDLNAGSEAYQAGDYKKAVRYYRKAAAAGNATALSNLGYCYYFGTGVPADKDLAKEFWEQAAIFEDIAAIYKLGDMYRFGDIEQNLEYSHRLYRRAFDLALSSSDIYVFPDAYLRMFRYYPNDLYADGFSARSLLERCIDGLRERIELGDASSEDLLCEAEEIMEKLPEEDYE